MQLMCSGIDDISWWKIDRLHTGEISFLKTCFENNRKSIKIAGLSVSVLPDTPIKLRGILIVDLSVQSKTVA